MKRNLTFLLILFSINLFSQTPCVNGMAGGFPCSNIDLQANLNLSEIGGVAGTEGSGCWGWTDPQTNKEYAIIGCTTHTAIVDVTVPHAPIYLGKINSQTSTINFWREVNVYNNHLYIVADNAGDHGMQIFDLTRLRNVTSVPQIFVPDARYSGFRNCHTISINYNTGFAFCNGSNLNSGGPHVLNLSNPKAPTVAMNYGTQGYTHDAQIVTYNGPDTEHIGKEIFIGANTNKVVVVDVTNKSAPVLLSTFTYANRGYTHQGWFTEDQRYWILGDETDETNFGFNSKTIVIDMTNLDAPVLKFNHFGATTAIDHNGYVKGNEFYLANYTAGIRILNTSNIQFGNSMNEIGFFDTYPENNNATYNGVWNVYPYFPSGTIIMSDIDRGLFIVRKSANLSSENFDKSIFVISPNPANSFVTIESSNEINKIEVYNILGKSIKTVSNLFVNNFRLDTSDLTSGIYLLKINDGISKKIIIE
jgi:choice-of-anchor B domain-containing protein